MNWNDWSDPGIPTAYTVNNFANLANTAMSIQDSVNAFQNAAIAQHFGSLQSGGCCTSLRDSEPIYVNGLAGAKAFKLPKNRSYITLHDCNSNTVYIKYENGDIHTFKCEEKERGKMLMDNNTKNPMSEMMKGSGAGDNNGMSAMFPMMLMMNGGGTGSILDGMFDFGEDEEEDGEDAGDGGETP